MSFTVQRVRPTEWRRLREIRLRALGDAPYAFGSTLEAEAARADDWWAASTERLAWFVAVNGNETQGLIAGMPMVEDEPGLRAVLSMWVAPGHRGTGMAQALLAAVVGWARADGATCLTLRVSEGNDRARRFYERLGFAPTGDREPLRSDPRLDAVEMRLILGRPRLRFAPSPAGDLHVGHVRTAVLTWILARQQAGAYFVRFENTDQTKELPGSRAAIVADLDWLGLLGPERPRDQAEMTDSHLAALARLASSGQTYMDGGAVRFRTPAAGTVEWDDLVRQRVTVRNDDLEDPVLVRSSGSPTFYLASTVDDAEEGISHLVRADPMRRATAKQIHIWRALGVEPPRVGHVPLVIGPRGAPIRFGTAEATVQVQRQRGISPMALVVYLAMPETASWKTPPTALDDILERVDLSRLPHRPTVFDQRALELLNQRLARRSGGLPSVISRPS